MKLIVTFRNFANAPKNCSLITPGHYFEINTHFLCDSRVDSVGKRSDLPDGQQKFNYQQEIKCLFPSPTLGQSGLQNNFDRDLSLKVKPTDPEIIHANLSSAAVSYGGKLYPTHTKNAFTS